jgi:polyisoprenoid-binding protein YceI
LLLVEFLAEIVAQEEVCLLVRFGEGKMESFGKLLSRAEELDLKTLIERPKKRTTLAVIILLASLSRPVFGRSQDRPIDRTRSTITVYVYKTGILSGLAHNHEIEAPIAWGEVKDSDVPSVELRVDSTKLRVLDPEASDGTRATIQATMQGAHVLDVGHFPEIHFRSTGVEPNGADHWMVHGNLDLHGQTHPVSFEVALKDGLYQGSAVLKQTGFGITPVKVAGGTVKVKDEVKVAFAIALLN